MPGKKSSTVPSEPPELVELRELAAKAKAGDASVLPRMRRLMDEHPEIHRHAGDLEKYVVRAWSELLAGEDRLALEAIKRKTEEMRRELAGSDPTPLESLLIGQVLASSLELSHAQLAAAEEKVSIGQAAFNLRRAESGSKRMLAAVRTLATLRQLLPRGLLPLNQLKLHDPDCESA